MIGEEVLVVGACLGVVSLIATAVVSISEAMTRSAWRRAARELHLSLDPGRWLRMPRIHGRIGDAEVRVGMRGMGQTLVVEVAGLGRYPSDVSFSRKVPGAADASTTGDALFDRDVRSLGQEHRVLAMLDHRARAVVRSCVAGACISTRSPPRDTELELEIQRAGDDDRTIVKAVRNLLAVAQAASLGTRTIPEALADNARDDLPGVRERCLAAMIDEYGRSALTDEACRAALADEDLDVRLAAARGLRHEPGLDAMLEGIVLDRRISPERRETALRLRLRAPIAEAGPLLGSLLDDADEKLRPLAIAVIGSRRWLPALDRLLELAGSPPHGYVAVLATTLGQLGDPRAQPILLRWLDREDVEKRVAVVTALARLGDVEAIPALEPLTHGMLTPSEVKQAARAAIRAIQARLGPADAGRLSLVDLDEKDGALSITDDASGRVSLPPA